MATFVLVHGALMGGWCWRRLTPLLNAAGHEVYPITLTGLGERVHLARPDVNLDTHIQDVVNVFEYEDLRDVILVGHSYGTYVITGVANRVSERIAHRVFLDGSGALAVDGEAPIDSQRPEARAAWQATVDAHGDGWRWLPAADLPTLVQRWGLREADAAWLIARATPQPWQAFVQPLRLTDPAGPSSPRTYIAGVGPGPQPSTMSARAEKIRADPGWRFRALATGHAAMITAPAELADLLLETAGGA